MSAGRRVQSRNNMGRHTLRSCDMRIKKPESYVEKDGRLYYIGNTDGSPRAAETHHRTNKNRMRKVHWERPPFAQAGTIQEL
jgi:hypothetical protein